MVEWTVVVTAPPMCGATLENCSFHVQEKLQISFHCRTFQALSIAHPEYC